MHHKCMYFPPKTKANHNFTPPFLLPLTNPLCMVVCQRIYLFQGKHYFLIKYGGTYQHKWGALGCSTLQTGQTALPYCKPGHKNTTTHNNQHEQASPYPPAALVLSLHGNICHGPISWHRCSLWVWSRCGAFNALSPLPVQSIGLPTQALSKRKAGPWP